MANYQLNQDEVVLLQCEAKTSDDKRYSELLLTNQHIVLIPKKGVFSRTNPEINRYSVKDIKVFEGNPQVKLGNQLVEVYFVSSKVNFEFLSTGDARKFINKLYDITTGMSATQRNAEIIKGAVSLVDDTLGIDTVGTIKNVMQQGVLGSILKGVGLNTVEKSVNLEEAKYSSSSIHEQADALIRLKELLDIGAITQEEFEAKKKQVLGL